MKFIIILSQLISLYIVPSSSSSSTTTTTTSSSSSSTSTSTSSSSSSSFSGRVDVVLPRSDDPSAEFIRWSSEDELSWAQFCAHNSVEAAMHGSTAILQRAIAAQHSKSEFAVIYPLMRTMVNHTMTNSIAQMFIFNAPAGDKVDLIFYFGDPHLQTLTVDEYADELEAAAQHFFTSGLSYDFTFMRDGQREEWISQMKASIRSDITSLPSVYNHKVYSNCKFWTQISLHSWFSLTLFRLRGR